MAPPEEADITASFVLPFIVIVPPELAIRETRFKFTFPQEISAPEEAEADKEPIVVWPISNPAPDDTEKLALSAFKDTPSNVPTELPA